MNSKTRAYIYSLMTDKASGIIANILQLFLSLLSFLYLAAIKIIFLLRQYGILPTMRLEAKVISIGNLTLGGTGKTPLVEFVVRSLLERNKKVVILTRGYRIITKENRMIPEHKLLLFEQIGDEPALLRLKLPQINILVGPDRVKNGRLAICNYGADVLVLDDGFQCWGLSRNIDILVIDATNPFGNQMLLPRGILREPVENLVRADIIVITKADIVQSQEVDAIRKKVRSLNPDALIISSIHKPVRVVDFSNLADKSYFQNGVLQLEWLRAKEVVAVCGIGDPDYFLKTLQHMGAVVKDNIIFEDHHPYTFQDLAVISSRCQQAGANIVITTEKDMIKLRPLFENHALAFETLQLKFLALSIQLELLDNQDKFIEHLLAK